MRILIIGADGQLGTDLCKVIPKNEQIPLTIKDLDITDREQVFKALKEHTPDVAINTAGYNHVDNAEDHEKEAFAVNATGAKYLAQSCREIGAKLAHISTDYVFDGEKKTPYLETDLPRPQSIYGISKLAGEDGIRNILQKHFIIRSAGLFGAAGCMGKGGGNFVEMMINKADQQLEIRVVDDEVLSPTYTLDLAEKIYELVQTDKYGIYHIVNHQTCSWYQFAVKVFEYLGKDIKVTPIKASEYKTRAKRPHYSVLKNAALAELCMDDLRSWEEALRAYLIEKGHIK